MLDVFATIGIRVWMSKMLFVIRYSAVSITVVGPCFGCTDCAPLSHLLEAPGKDLAVKVVSTFLTPYLNFFGFFGLGKI